MWQLVSYCNTLRNFFDKSSKLSERKNKIMCYFDSTFWRQIQEIYLVCGNNFEIHSETILLCLLWQQSYRRHLSVFMDLSNSRGICNIGKCNIENFRCRRWGSSLPVLCTLDPPLSPPSNPVEIFSAHVCKFTFTRLPQPDMRKVQNFLRSNFWEI